MGVQGIFEKTGKKDGQYKIPKKKTISLYRKWHSVSPSAKDVFIVEILSSQNF